MKRCVKRKLLVFTAALMATTASKYAADAAPATPPLKTKSGTEVSKDLVSTTTAKTPSYNAKALRRLDFKITGKSCAVCLLGIQKRMAAVPGAIKAAVQLQSPYAAVVLFDSSKTNQKALLAKAKESEPDVKFESIEETTIDKLPIVLVPKIGDTILTH